MIIFITESLKIKTKKSRINVHRIVLFLVTHKNIGVPVRV